MPSTWCLTRRCPAARRTPRLGSPPDDPAARTSPLADRPDRQRFPHSEVKLVDTVCRPTKDRQTAAVKLAQTSDVVVVIGGVASNNTRSWRPAVPSTAPACITSRQRMTCAWTGSSPPTGSASRREPRPLTTSLTRSRRACTNGVGPRISAVRRAGHAIRGELVALAAC